MYIRYVYGVLSKMLKNLEANKQTDDCRIQQKRGKM